MSGIWDAITGQNPNQGAINSASSSANAATANQNTNLNAQTGIYNNLASGFNTNYAPLQGGTMGGFQGLLGPAGQAGGLQNTLMQALGSPSGTGAFTGINGGSLLNSALGTASGANMGIGGAMGQNQGINYGALGQLGTAGGVFGGMAMNGLSPSVIGNAMGNYQNGVQQQMNTEMNQLGPGVNAGALAQSLGQQSIMGQAQLQSDLAAQNQGVMAQGATGLGNVASGMSDIGNSMFSNTLGGLGQQVSNANSNYNLGQGYNQTALGNLNTAAGIPMTDLSALQNYIGQGLGSLTGAASGLGSVASAYGGQAGMYGGLANQYTQEGQAQNAMTMNMLGSGLGYVSGMGGFGALASNLFGGGGGGGNSLGNPLAGQQLSLLPSPGGAPQATFAPSTLMNNSAGGPTSPQALSFGGFGGGKTLG
jgi:hypothetical protein